MKRISTIILGIILGIFILGGTIPASAAVEADGSVIINEANFPDEAFRAYVTSYECDNNQNGILEQEERERTKWITIDFSEYFYYQHDGAPVALYSCRGIEYFPNIKSLTIYNFDCLKERIEGLSQLESISIRNHNNEKLTMQEITQKIPVAQIKRLKLANCEMDVLDLSQFEKLEELSVTHDDDDDGGKIDLEVTEGITHVGEMNLRKNMNLKCLSLEALDLKKLDLSRNKKLEDIQFKDMKIPSGLKWMSFTELQQMSILNVGNVKNLDLSKNKKLKKLILSRAKQLKSLVLPKNGGLRTFELSNANKLKKLDLSAQRELRNLSLSNLTCFRKLDLSKNRKLKTLSLNAMIILKKLYLRENKTLKELSIFKKGPKKLDLTKNTQLKEMYLDYPGIHFKLAKRNSLEKIGFHASYVTIDLSTCTTSLKQISNQSYGCGAKVKMKRKVFEKLWNSGKLVIDNYGSEKYTKENKKVIMPKKGKYVYVSI